MGTPRQIIMPKLILDQSKFIQGLSDNNKSGNYALRDIDIYRDYGYLVPGFLHSDITITGLASDIIEIIDDPVNSRAYLLGNGGRVYGVNTSTDADLGDSFGGGAQNYNVVAGLTEAKGLVAYSAADTAYKVFFAYNGTAKNIAKGNLTTDWSGANLDQDWGSTVPTGGDTLQVGRRDMIEWRTFLWVTNGRYLGKIDTLAATAVFTPDFYDFGLGWTTDRVFPVGNYLGIVASKAKDATAPGSIYAPSSGRNTNECKIHIINLAGDLMNIIPLEGITQVHSIINRNGTIIVFADDRSKGHIVAVLGEGGLEEVKRLQHDVSGTLNTFLSPRSQSAVTIYKNQVLFGTESGGTTTGRGFVFGYGRKDIAKQHALYQPYSLSEVAGSRTTSLKQIYTDKLYAGYFDNSDYKLSKLTTGYSTSANYLPGYTDLGQRVVLNYVEIFFKPLVASDSITVGIDTDYGTSHTIEEASGVISHTADGALTYKKFDLAGQECHAFRPTISWSAGGVAISKIVVDYTFINN